MKRTFIPVLITLVTVSMTACKSSPSVPPVFCDTFCIGDTIKYMGNHKSSPVVYITGNQCRADSIIWTYNGMGSFRKTSFSYLIGTTVHVNENFMRCFFRENQCAWLLFNDCLSGRGFQVKLPYNKDENFSLRSSGINDGDPKFSVSFDLIAYTDRGNLFVEDMLTGKQATMTFGQALPIDYDYLHDYIDSVNITHTRIWARVKIDNEWKELEKKITLE